LGAQSHYEIAGFRIYPGYLDKGAQSDLVQDLRAVIRAAPLVQPVTPGGRKMSVRMTAAGPFGWVSDRTGYGYSKHQPTGAEWPGIPPSVLAIWQDLSECPRMPECCLVNWYAEGARMGLHRDADEADVTCPVVSVSLGDDGLFRMGGSARGGPTQSIWLRSGDVVVMGGRARLAFHGVDRIRFGTSTLLPRGGRINLTLRVVT
jgi:alkylated DNA repair protein (DNA oxidative demethylase)